MKKFIVTAVTALAVLGTVSVADAAQYVYSGELLKVESRGSQVYNLQECLAKLGNNPTTNIDGVYGSKTKAAVMSFQRQHALMIDGIVGKQTGPKYTTECAKVYAPKTNLPAGCTSTTGYSTTTGKKCDVVTSTLPAGCTSTAGYSTTTGKKCDSTTKTTLPAGCTSTAGYSSTTGKKCDGGSSSNFDSTKGKEGNLRSVKIRTGSDSDLISNQKNQSLFELEIEAEEKGSDVKIERIDLKFAAGTSASTDDYSTREYRVVQKVNVEGFGSMTTSDRADWRGADDDTIRLTGEAVVKAGERKTFVVKVDTSDFALRSGEAQDLKLVSAEVRYIDEAGLTETQASTGDSTVSTSTGTDFALRTLRAETNQETKMAVDVSSRATDKTIAIIEAEVKKDVKSGILEDLVVTLQQKAGTATSYTDMTKAQADAVISQLKLFIDGKLVDTATTAATGTDGSFKFDLNNKTANARDKFKIVIKADFERQAESGFASEKVKVAKLTFVGESDHRAFTANASNKLMSEVTGTIVSTTRGDIEYGVTNVVTTKTGDYAGSIEFDIEVRNDSGNNLVIKKDLSDWVWDIEGLTYKNVAIATPATATDSALVKVYKSNDATKTALAADVTIANAGSEKFTVSLKYDGVVSGKSTDVKVEEIATNVVVKI